MSPLFRLPRPVRLAALALLGLGLAWLGGFVAFLLAMPVQVKDPDTVTDAIVVLTGGSERVAGGLALLEKGKGRKLLISGVHKGVELHDVLRRAGRAAGEVPCCVVLGHAADDTVGNAAETAAWMEAEGFKTLRLVTASYHMRRSLLEFRRALPGVAVVAHPVFPEVVKPDQWRWRPGVIHLLANEYTKYLGALARPLFIPKPPERKP